MTRYEEAIALLKLTTPNGCACVSGWDGDDDIICTNCKKVQKFLRKIKRDKPGVLS